MTTQQKNKKTDYPAVIRELMTAVESMRMACEHSEGRAKKDRERLSHAMSVGIKVNAKYAGLVPDYQHDSFWADVHKLKG